MSPAPTDPKSNKFSNRLRRHGKLGEHWERRGDDDEGTGCVWAVHDQLLVSKRVSGDVVSWLRRAEIDASPVNDLKRTLVGLDAALDIDILQLTLPRDRDVFSVTHDLREEVVPSNRNTVSPNHILIPASWGNACPSGPPSEYDGAIPSPPTEGFSPAITLIDSGYQWNAHWGGNPLETLLGHDQSVQPGLWPSDTGWAATPGDVPDGDHPSKPRRLDALAGHANFAAGELAQRCYHPRITIWNHNGSCVGDDLAHIPTEAAVLNSLLLSQQLAPTPVILTVFAFNAFESLPAAVWQDTLRQIEGIHNDNFVLVAPTGNQSSTIPRFPAALPSERVIGVASLTPDGADCSLFSNRGTEDEAWVTCSAIGEDVVSTFLHVDLVPEEDPEPPGSPRLPYDFAGHNSWSVWQGTSFAAPKIAAAIANELRNEPRALDAWAALAAGRPADAEVGMKFEDLG